jgi:hypothetical protein
VNNEGTLPYQNRVTPFGEFEATSARGLCMGNRGILHDDQGGLGPARLRHKNWIVCALSFKGRKAAINPPGHYTQLFFCDEATALAAGHRPCAKCRRPDYRRYVQAWQRARDLQSPPEAGEIDNALHQARVTPHKRQVRTHAKLVDLPDGALISLSEHPGEAWLVWQDRLHRWTHEGYSEYQPMMPEAEVVVLTPEPTVSAFNAGYIPMVHPSAYR